MNNSHRKEETELELILRKSWRVESLLSFLEKLASEPASVTAHGGKAAGDFFFFPLSLVSSLFSFLPSSFFFPPSFFPLLRNSFSRESRMRMFQRDQNRYNDLLLGNQSVIQCRKMSHQIRLKAIDVHRSNRDEYPTREGTSHSNKIPELLNISHF